MVLCWCRALLLLLLTGEGFCRCFESVGCTGSLVSAYSKRDCCVGTNDGLSFHDGVSCTNCIDTGLASENILSYSLLSCSPWVPSGSV